MNEEKVKTKVKHCRSRMDGWRSKSKEESLQAKEKEKEKSKNGC
jgi:hypothetical protein